MSIGRHEKRVQRTSGEDDRVPGLHFKIGVRLNLRPHLAVFQLEYLAPGAVGRHALDFHAELVELSGARSTLDLQDFCGSQTHCLLRGEFRGGWRATCDDGRSRRRGRCCRPFWSASSWSKQASPSLSSETCPQDSNPVGAGWAAAQACPSTSAVINAM